MSRATVSIHVPLAEHDAFPNGDVPEVRLVSIHVPLAEHDLPESRKMQSMVVSIHVPLAEHDLLLLPSCPDALRFNSRAPRGARRRRKSPVLHDLQAFVARSSLPRVALGPVS